ncbi:hypothetical protein FKP32DRAFT_1173969 [Trametes sanguinea]|nr:hypothetical protein FKP32DRAFT_1173969 [Trametes sanguinea]
MSEHTSQQPLERFLDMTYSTPPSSVHPSHSSFGRKSLEPQPYGDIAIGIINSSLTDDELSELAQVHLSVLESPTHGIYNKPGWVENLKKAMEFETSYTTASMIRAMYDTASTVRLPSGARYVSAAVCACAAGSKEAEAERSLTDSERREAEKERLAASLEKLASTWVSYMLWPSKRFKFVLATETLR